MKLALDVTADRYPACLQVALLWRNLEPSIHEASFGGGGCAHPRHKHVRAGAGKAGFGQVQGVYSNQSMSLSATKIWLQFGMRADDATAK